MATLLLRLEGPMQSWGFRSRYKDRDTATEPTRSGVIGLLCAALGRRREEPLDDLLDLSMSVRVDREGIVMQDYHTAGGGSWQGSPYGVAKADESKPETVVSTRHFLADACFLVALEGREDLLQNLHKALRDPVWPLYLGRKSFPPSPPVWLKDGFGTARAEQLLHEYPYLGRAGEPPARLRLVAESAPGYGEPQRDIPVRWADPLKRDFDIRYVRTSYIPCPKVMGGSEKEGDDVHLTP